MTRHQPPPKPKLLTLITLTLGTGVYELIITIINLSLGKTWQTGLAALGFIFSLIATYLVSVRRMSILTISRVALPFAIVWTTLNIFLASQKPDPVSPRVYMTYLILVGFAFALLRVRVAAGISFTAFTGVALVSLTRAAPDHGLLTDVGFLTLLFSFLAVFGRQTDEQRRKTRDFADLALRDSLTELPNRRAAEDRLNTWMNRESRPAGAALILCDLDHFKKLNDTHGHNTGDEALRRVAVALQKHVRQEDLVCRWGGEEFLILMQDITPADAIQVAERMRKEVGEIRLGIPRQLTLSGGVVMLDEAYSLPELLALADRRLYTAKNEGRNRINASSVRFNLGNS